MAPLLSRLSNVGGSGGGDEGEEYGGSGAPGIVIVRYLA